MITQRLGRCIFMISLSLLALPVVAGEPWYPHVEELNKDEDGNYIYYGRALPFLTATVEKRDLPQHTQVVPSPNSLWGASPEEFAKFMFEQTGVVTRFNVALQNPNAVGGVSGPMLNEFEMSFSEANPSPITRAHEVGHVIRRITGQTVNYAPAEEIGNMVRNTLGNPRIRAMMSPQDLVQEEHYLALNAAYLRQTQEILAEDGIKLRQFLEQENAKAQIIGSLGSGRRSSGPANYRIVSNSARNAIGGAAPLGTIGDTVAGPLDQVVPGLGTGVSIGAVGAEVAREAGAGTYVLGYGRIMASAASQATILGLYVYGAGNIFKSHWDWMIGAEQRQAEMRRQEAERIDTRFVPCD